MFSKYILCLAAALSLLSLASAQIEDDSLDELNAWGQRYLSAGEPEFPTTLWQGSDSAMLLDTLRSLQVRHFTPAQRQLLRRLVLSPAEAPQGEAQEALLAERARLMLALGEPHAAQALFPSLQQEVGGWDSASLSADLDMAAGREASACGALNGGVREGDYWLKLRAVCAVLVDNFSGAELAIEFAEAQGVSDPWLIEAIFAASGDVPELPQGRYDSGLNIALSTKARLDTTQIILAGAHPYLAAAAAQRPGVPSGLRVRLAALASQMDLIAPQIRRQILFEHLSQTDYEPSLSLERGLVLLMAPDVSEAERTKEVYRLLGQLSLADLDTYRRRAQLLLPDLRRIRANTDTAAYALRFARASFAAGDPAQARRWLASLDMEGAPRVDPFMLTFLEAVDLMSGGDASVPSQKAIARRLIAAISNPEQDKQAAKLFSLWTGLGYRLDAAARSRLNLLEPTDWRLSPQDMARMSASAAAGAVAETSLHVLRVLQSVPDDRLSTPDLAVLLQALRQIDAADIAADLALEHLAYWREQPDTAENPV